MTKRTRPTQEQINELKEVYRKLTHSDNRRYCRYLLKTYGIRTATAYAKVILNPIGKWTREPSLHLTPYRSRKRG